MHGPVGVRESILRDILWCDGGGEGMTETEKNFSTDKRPKSNVGVNKSMIVIKEEGKIHS